MLAVITVAVVSAGIIGVALAMIIYGLKDEGFKLLTTTLGIDLAYALLIFVIAIGG